MAVKILTKPQTQQMIKALRDAGFTVNKLSSGYACEAINNATNEKKTVFKAMVGSRGYLVTYEDSLFQAA